MGFRGFAGTCSQEETKNECLKSLMATYLYPKMVLDYTNDGVNFKEHLYVLEFDPRTDWFITGIKQVVDVA